MATDTTAPTAAAAPEAPADAEAGARQGRLAGLLIPVILLLIAGAVRFVGLSHPERIYFDETYYAPQGLELLERGVEAGFAVHPPVGKWLIAGGIAAFGYDTFGFRAGAAAAGTLTVLATYLMGLRLFRRRGVAALAAFLVTIDGLMLTMSRISMLDIFLAMFVGFGIWALLKDRDLLWADLVTRDASAPLPLRSHRWRWVAGLVLGLALATKWSAVLVIAAAGLFVLTSELLWRRRVSGSARNAWWRAVGSATVTLAVVPLLVYVLSYAGWWFNFSETRLGLERCPDGVCELSVPQLVGEWWGEQRQIAHFHTTLEAEHPYRSRPVTWPYLGRPIAYYYESCNDEKLAAGDCVTEQGNVEEILGIGNPAIWWLGLLAFPIAAWFAVRDRDWRPATILGFYAAQYVPWLLVSRPNFLFYLTPAVPFLCLAVAFTVWRVSGRPLLRWLPAATAVITVGAFLFWFPLWTGQEITLESWRLRIWFNSWI